MILPVEVVEATRAGRCVLVLGTRASLEAAALGGSTWPFEKDVARELGWRPARQLLGARNRAVIPSVAASAEAFEAAHGRDALLSELEARLSGRGVAPSVAHSAALERFPLVLCTAWDDLLDRAAAGVSRPVRFVDRDEPLPERQPGRSVVLRMRGSFARRDTILVTQGDLQRHPWPAETRRALREIIRTNVIFFAGFRPDEEEFEQLFAELTGIYDGELPRCHLAVAQGRLDDILWQRWVWRGLLLFTADASECLSELVRLGVG
jgi:hypothetical protein